MATRCYTGQFSHKERARLTRRSGAEFLDDSWDGQTREIVDLDDFVPPGCALNNLEGAFMHAQTLGQQFEQGLISSSIHRGRGDAHLECVPFLADLVCAAAWNYTHLDAHNVLLPAGR